MILVILGLLTLGVHFHIAFIKRRWYADPRMINLEGSKPEVKND